MIETEIYALLIGNATVKRLINDRVYPIVMPQDGDLPCITYQRTAGNPINHLRGYSGLANPHITINSWASNYDTAKEVAKAVHVTMDKSTGFKNTLFNQIDAFDPEIELFAVSQDYSCWDQE